MDKLVWNTTLDTGIGVIDRQHRRIVDCINQLHDAHANGNRPEQVRRVIEELMDYTRSHFTFEEALQEEARYPFCKAHKRVHDTFVQHVQDYRERFDRGEDVIRELHVLLVTWLYNHIAREDADYIEDVRAVLQKDELAEQKRGFFARLFL